MSRSARREQASARPLACPWTTHGCLPGVHASVQVRPSNHRSDSARRITGATALVDRFQTLARTRRAWSPTVSWLSQCVLDRMACRRERQAVVRACCEGRHPRIRYAGLPSRSGLGGTAIMEGADMAQATRARSYRTPWLPEAGGTSSTGDTGHSAAELSAAPGDLRAPTDDVQQQSTATVPPLDTARTVQMMVDGRRPNLLAGDAAPWQAGAPATASPAPAQRCPGSA